MKRSNWVGGLCMVAGCCMKALFFAALLATTLPMAIAQESRQELVIRRAIDSKVSQLWDQEDFRSLDALAHEYRGSKSRTPSGLWELTVFYGSLQGRVKGPQDPAWWDRALQRSRRWIDLNPDSASARLQHAETVIQRGWQARGSGFSSAVTPEGAREFRERIAEARKLLEESKKIASPDPR